MQDTWTGVVGKVKIGVVHGGLTDPHNEFIHAYTDDVLVGSYFKKLGVKVLVVGHSHQMFVKQLKEGLLINPGSIGQPLDNDPNPSYVIIEVKDGSVETIIPKRFKYDFSLVEEKMNAEMLPKSFTERLRRGY